MSRLSDILGVKEGQEFRFDSEDIIYQVIEDVLYYYRETDEIWGVYYGFTIYNMIDQPELIRIITEMPKLTEQQLTAIKGRIAEGTLWAARDKDKEAVWFYPKKHTRNLIDFEGDGNVINSRLYDFITFENSPIYLPDLIKR